MFNYRWMFLLALCSVSSFAEVDFEEKKNRVEYLETLSKTATSMNIEAFHRELKYEAEGLSLSKRAENESLLLAEKIQIQVLKAYEEALKKNGTQEAAAEVLSAIDKDLALINEELREEIRELAVNALENAQRGQTGISHNLEKIQESLLKGVKERSEYLNQEEEFIPEPLMLTNSGKVDSSHYNNKQALIDALVSDDVNNTRVFTSNVNFKSSEMFKFDSKISLQLKVNFLGVALDAGPTFSFNRQYITHYEAIAEGLHPALTPTGHFDFTKRDTLGRVVSKNGKPQKRTINFACSAVLNFSTEYSGAGGFSVMGLGGNVQSAKNYANSVEMNSRRVVIPETINGKVVNVQMLSNICHNDFLKAKITKTMTVANSLNIMMKNVVAGLSFTHPKTSCAVDSQCRNWYNNEIISLVKRNNVARCVENKKEKYMACELRGRENQACPVYNEKGRRVSGGAMEFTCDQGLYCKTIRPAGMFFTAVGRCTKR